MKEHFYRTVLKTLALSCVAAVALFGTATTLSSCGGGSGEPTKQELALRTLIENRSILLAKGGANGIQIRVFNQVGRTSAYECTVYWGNDGIVTPGILRVRPSSMAYEDGGKVSSMTFEISSFSEKVTVSTGFVGFWGINKNYTGVSVSGMTVTLKDLHTVEMVTDGSFEALTSYEASDSSTANSPVSEENWGINGFVLIQDGEFM